MEDNNKLSEKTYEKINNYLLRDEIKDEGDVISLYTLKNALFNELEKIYDIINNHYTSQHSVDITRFEIYYDEDSKEVEYALTSYIPTPGRILTFFIARNKDGSMYVENILKSFYENNKEQINSDFDKLEEFNKTYKSNTCDEYGAPCVFRQTFEDDIFKYSFNFNSKYNYLESKEKNDSENGKDLFKFINENENEIMKRFPINVNDLHDDIKQAYFAQREKAKSKLLK